MQVKCFNCTISQPLDFCSSAGLWSIQSPKNVQLAKNCYHEHLFSVPWSGPGSMLWNPLDPFPGIPSLLPIASTYLPAKPHRIPLCTLLRNQAKMIQNPTWLILSPSMTGPTCSFAGKVPTPLLQHVFPAPSLRIFKLKIQLRAKQAQAAG